MRRHPRWICFTQDGDPEHGTLRKRDVISELIKDDDKVVEKETLFRNFEGRLLVCLNY